MYAYLKGRLEEIDEQKVVIDVNGIGYMVTVPQSIISKLPPKGDLIKLYTCLILKDNCQELYGFIDRSQKYLFGKLITVSGIGPKGAMALLSILSPDQIALAIVTSDVKTLTTAPGIGKKTAQRMILELKEKIDNNVILDNQDAGLIPSNSEKLNEVVQALSALGYHYNEIQHAMKGITDFDSKDISQLIKTALGNLSTKQ